MNNRTPVFPAARRALALSRAAYLDEAYRLLSIAGGSHLVELADIMAATGMTDATVREHFAGRITAGLVDAPEPRRQEPKFIPYTRAEVTRITMPGRQEVVA